MSSKHLRGRAKAGYEDARLPSYQRLQVWREKQRRWKLFRALERDVEALPPASLLLAWADGKIPAETVLQQWRGSP